uniref:ubiquitinyl hydrolase 1 n=1 Tax=Palpitomonas bilix TaxID=652834 RepID=A0A7S3DEG2_9EUKA
MIYDFVWRCVRSYLHIGGKQESDKEGGEEMEVDEREKEEGDRSDEHFPSEYAADVNTNAASLTSSSFRQPRPSPPSTSPTSSDHTSSKDGEEKVERKGKEETQSPFVIRCVTRTGDECCYCKWNKFCMGCVLKCNDDALPNQFVSHSCFLSIDWSPSVLQSLFDKSEAEKVEDHPSVERCHNLLHKPMSIDKCLHAFTEEEKLGEDDYWYCPKCKDFRSASKKLDIWKTPRVLVLHLKRFMQMGNSSVMRKTHIPVHFPVDDLSLESSMSIQAESRMEVERSMNGEGKKRAKREEESGEERNRGDKQQKQMEKEGGEEERKKVEVVEEQNVEVMVDADAMKEVKENGGATPSPPPRSPPLLAPEAHGHTYKLVATSNHYGALGAGHYIAYGRNEKGQWHSFDDSRVTAAKVEDITPESAYLMVYVRDDIDSFTPPAHLDEASCTQRPPDANKGKKWGSGISGFFKRIFKS